APASPASEAHSTSGMARRARLARERVPVMSCSGAGLSHQEVMDLGEGHVDGLAIPAALVFHGPGLDAAVAHHQAVGNAHQLHIGQHGAEARLVDVHQQDVVAPAAQFAVEILAGLAHAFGLVGIDRPDGDLEGRDGIAPDDAVGIVVLVDGGCDDAADADAVTAHDHGLFAAFLAEYLRAHGLAVLGAELEDVANLYAATDFQSALAVRARISAHHIADVLDAAGGAVTSPIDTGEMMAVAIGATGEIGEHCSGAVDNGGDGQVDGTDGADAAADGGFHFSLAGEGQGGRHAGEFFGFDVVEHVVASQHQRHQAAVLLALHDQGFHRALGTDAKVLA